MNGAVAELVKDAKRHGTQDDAPPFKLVPIAQLNRQPPPEPVYAWEGIAPVGEVTYWTAHGGTSKGVVMLMLSAATVRGEPLFGVPTRQANVCFYSAEDSQETLQHRLHFICKAMGVDPASLADHVFILDVAGDESRDPALYKEVTAAGRKEGATTGTYSDLKQFAKDKAIGLLIIDNASDVFDASEIDRARVRGFIRSLAQLARECNLAVILLGHVDKGTSRGDRSGTEAYSGSTAWNNSPRSRVHQRLDKDVIVIEHQKHNLGPLHESIRLTWPKGGVPQLEESFGPVVQGIEDRKQEKALLKLIAKFTDRGELIGTAETGRGCITSKFEHEDTMPKFKKPSECFHILRQSVDAGRLARTAIRTADRKTREVWMVTDAGRQFADIPALQHAPNAQNDDFGATPEIGAVGRAKRAKRVAGGVGGERAHEFSAEESPE